MTGTWSSFLPGLAVLAIGLAAGLLLAARLRRGRVEATAKKAFAQDAAPDERDLELERADLEARRAEIYARLRGETGDELGEAERRDLERSAARILRRLEAIDAQTSPRRRAAAREAVPPAGAFAAAAATPAPAVRPRGRHAGVVGFAFGAGFAALAALLFYWVGRDATPRPDEPSGPMAGAGAGDAAAADGDPVHSRLDELSPEARARVTAIMARLDEEPRDLDARKALAETFVVEGLFFEAFEQSERILEQSPGDVDGLYFQGLIRLTMGQDDIATELLDQALEREPGFVSARLVRGLARLRQNQRDAAIEDWRLGLEAAGGRHEGLERLLELASSGASAEEILGSPPPSRLPEGHPEIADGEIPQTQSPAGAPVPRADDAPGSTATGAAPADTVYHARIEIDSAAASPPGAVLFVNLRIVAGAGPPSAVKRVESPRFPLDITLGPGDAMPGLQGRPLPVSGVISARLDADGNASTRDPAEPSAQVEAAIGEPVTLLLRREPDDAR